VAEGLNVGSGHMDTPKRHYPDSPIIPTRSVPSDA